jgi:hypothetical protein
VGWAGAHQACKGATIPGSLNSVEFELKRKTRSGILHYQEMKSAPRLQRGRNKGRQQSASMPGHDDDAATLLLPNQSHQANWPQTHRNATTAGHHGGTPCPLNQSRQWGILVPCDSRQMRVQRTKPKREGSTLQMQERHMYVCACAYTKRGRNDARDKSGGRRLGCKGSKGHARRSKIVCAPQTAGSAPTQQ